MQLRIANHNITDPHPFKGSANATKLKRVD